MWLVRHYQWLRPDGPNFTTAAYVYRSTEEYVRDRKLRCKWPSGFSDFRLPFASRHTYDCVRIFHCLPETRMSKASDLCWIHGVCLSVRILLHSMQSMSSSSRKSWIYCTRRMWHNSPASPGHAPSSTREHSGCRERRASLAPPQAPCIPHTELPSLRQFSETSETFRASCLSKQAKKLTFPKISEKCGFLNALPGEAGWSASRKEGEHSAQLPQESPSHPTRVTRLSPPCC